MLVNLPLICPGLGYRDGQRSQWSCITQTVDVKEMGDNFEVAATGIPTGGGDRISVLWHEGAHWIRETMPREGMNLSRLDPEPLGREHAADRIIDGHAFAAYVAAMSDPRRAAKAVSNWRKAYATGRNLPMPRLGDREMAEALDNMDHALDSLRVLDRHLYRRIPKPVYAIGHVGNVGISFEGRPGARGAFGLDRLDDLKEHVAARLGLSWSVPNDGREILMPETFAVNDERLSLEPLVVAYQKWGRRFAPHRGAEFRALSSTLSDAADLFHADGSDEACEAAVDALDGFASYFSRAADAAEARAPGTSKFFREGAAELALAVTRWRERPISLAARPGC